nr:alanine racemase C-terminal domain-containing protein [Vibrio sp. R-1]
MYGVSPFSTPYASHYGLRPAMTLKSSLIAVREHKAGEAVGYGGCWISERDTRIGNFHRGNHVIWQYLKCHDVVTFMSRTADQHDRFFTTSLMVIRQ